MGIITSVIVILLWAAHLIFILTQVTPSAGNPWMYLHILIQGYLYTGLFITAHDAMHGTISGSKTVNTFFGTAATFLFAGLSYSRLKKNHGLHHKYPASEKDPDFYVKSQNFWKWWAVFMWRYLTWMQLLIMAVMYNLLIHVAGLPEVNVLVFWVLPAFLGTLQLFWVGVWWPHRLPHRPDMEPHKARTQQKNHLWAMISCYFFGYHYEHHQNPGIPWWKLYKSK
jgi:beta-carotene/zeaxanthin 4-ketolase